VLGRDKHKFITIIWGGGKPPPQTPPLEKINKMKQTARSVNKTKLEQKIGRVHVPEILGVHPLRSLATSVLMHFGPFAIKDRSGCPVRSFVTSVLCQFGP